MEIKTLHFAPTCTAYSGARRVRPVSAVKVRADGLEGATERDLAKRDRAWCGTEADAVGPMLARFREFGKLKGLVALFGAAGEVSKDVDKLIGLLARTSTSSSSSWRTRAQRRMVWQQAARRRLQRWARWLGSSSRVWREGRTSSEPSCCWTGARPSDQTHHVRGAGARMHRAGQGAGRSADVNFSERNSNSERHGVACSTTKG